MTSPNAFVRKIRAYGLLSDGEVRRLVEASDPPRKVGAHRDLIREGDKPSALFVILEGWACRYKDLPDGSRQIMAFLLPGDFCDVHIGELEEMDHSIGTLTTCQVASIPHTEIEALVVSTRARAKAFWRAQLIDVTIGRSVASMAHLMLELYVRMRNIGIADDNSCELPLTQAVLGDALGLTSVHVNRVLRDLRERGVMELGSKMLRILDIAAMAKIAGFDGNYLHRKIKMVA